jgi:hypothetical protein
LGTERCRQGSRGKEEQMRVPLFSLALTLMALTVAPGPATAREYPWCARYDWTTSNCGFVSLRQCLATISGIGGRCEPNPRYVPQGRRRG